MTPTKRINILVYSGAGASLSSVRHATWSLRRLLGPNYAVLTVTSDQILKEPWPASCAMLVMPGGADSGYCRLLNGEGNRRIRQYVLMGGKYLGLCAGGYYGSAKCEFEVGKKGMEVVGERELAFFPGICRGLAFPGFVYASEAGARVVDVKVAPETLGGALACQDFRSYYNGGGVFVDAETFDGVEVLASFGDDLAVDSGKSKAAVVYCKVGEGAAVLTGPHPEFAGINLNRDEPSNPHYGELIDALLADDAKRTDFMKACLTKLGLIISQETPPVPSLSHLHLSSALHGEVSELLHAWQEAGIVTTDDGEEYIKGEQDTFLLEKTSGWSMANVANAVADVIPDAVKNAVSSTSSARDSQTNTDYNEPDRILDYNAVVKRILPHTEGLPDPKSTSHFNHHAFYTNLQHYQRLHPEISGDYGRVLLYGEVVTSTQSILDKNPTWLSHLPIGTTATATTQLVGRGRGTNVWVAPPGSLVFSTILKHSLSLSTSAPVVFVQYLAALAIVAGINNYGKGYDKLPIKLKWPNDVYALDPTTKPGEEDRYVKISGILVNSSYSGGDYTLIVGIGLNVLNAAPTTSLQHLAQKAKLPAPILERLLASILVEFEALYARFCRTGWDKSFEEKYHNAWLHSDQIVTLEMEGSARARVKGITRDWGLLVAEELGFEDRPTGRRWELQSDSNSFDFFKGLVKRKT